MNRATDREESPTQNQNRVGFLPSDFGSKKASEWAQVSGDDRPAPWVIIRFRPRRCHARCTV